MGECCGWMGRIFGHKMVKFCLKNEGPSPEQIEQIRLLELLWNDSRLDALRQACTLTNTVCCARCGAKEKA